MENVIKNGHISTISNYFGKEKTERLIASNENNAGILYCIIRYYKNHPRSGLDLEGVEKVCEYDEELDKVYFVEESDLELLIQERFLIKEDEEYFIPDLHYKEKLRQEKENGQQFLFPDLMKARLDNR